MKRTIKLTESELIKVIEKIIKEGVKIKPSPGTISPGARIKQIDPKAHKKQNLDTPVKIKAISISDKKVHLLDITSYFKSGSFCMFGGYFKDSTTEDFAFEWDLSKPRYINLKNIGECQITEQGASLLGKLCGSSEYVSTQKSSNNYV